MKKGIIISTILVLFLAGIAFSRGWRGGSSGGWKGGYGGGWYGPPFASLALRFLDLPPDRKSAIEGIRDGHSKEAEAIYAKIREIVNRLGANLKQKKSNLAEAETDMRNIGNLRSELSIKWLHAIQEAKNNLTDEEFATLLEKIAGSKQGS